MSAGSTEKAPGQNQGPEEQTAAEPKPAKPTAEAPGGQAREAEADASKPRSAEGRSHEHDNQELPLGWKFTFAFAEIILAGAICLAAFVQADITRRQGDEMILQRGEMKKQTELSGEQLRLAKLATEQTEIAIQQSREAQRAWLSLAYPTMSNYNVGQAILGTITIRNTGPTPGKIIRSLFVYGLAANRAEIADQVANMHATDDRETLLIPGADLKHGTKSTNDLSLTQAVMDEIERGDRKLYLFCELVYTDVIGEERHTRACFIYTPRSTGGTGHFTTHYYHNHMD